MPTDPLPICPHMATRCPHRREECDDPRSASCHYVKNTGHNVFANLRYLADLVENGKADGRVHGQMDAIKKFIADSKAFKNI